MDYQKTGLILDEDDHSTYKIDRYEPGCVWVNKTVYTKSLIIRPHLLITDWRPTSINDLSITDFDFILDTKPDVLLLGTGESLVLPDEALMEALFSKGIGVECMNNRAACHTYTALASEYREVTACLIF